MAGARRSDIPATAVIIAFVLMTSAAIHAFGWWLGAGVASAVYLLMPWRP